MDADKMIPAKDKMTQAILLAKFVCEKRARQLRHTGFRRVNKRKLYKELSENGYQIEFMTFREVVNYFTETIKRYEIKK